MSWGHEMEGGAAAKAKAAAAAATAAAGEDIFHCRKMSSLLEERNKLLFFNLKSYYPEIKIFLFQAIVSMIIESYCPKMKMFLCQGTV